MDTNSFVIVKSLSTVAKIRNAISDYTFIEGMFKSGLKEELAKEKLFVQFIEFL